MDMIPKVLTIQLLLTMPSVFGLPNYDFLKEDEAEDQKQENTELPNLKDMAFGYLLLLVVMMLAVLIMFFCLRLIGLRQKTRSPQQRRMYVGSRARPSLGQTEPTIFVSPSNYPPPPKYECMAPPSYEEVVGVHYPNYQPQPITQPIATALAQSTQGSSTRSNDNETNTVPETVVTVTDRTITVSA